MNIQALMKQAQNIQRDMEKTKKEIDDMIFEEKNGVVSVKANGKKEILEIKIDIENADKEDIEAIQDMFLLAINQLFSRIDKTIQEKMGKFTSIPGIF
ncbi:MAG: YbaB/EbfC family nucleoid-associated protein [bacterium]|nr:YbaB/EbfC family nucleoid-associated protein [bacterium]